MFWRRSSIARRLFVANLVFVLVLTAAVAAVMVSDAGSRTYAQTSQRMLSVATALADSPFVHEASVSADPTTLLQPYAKEVMRDAGVDFITIMSPSGIRWTHPNPAEIGQPYVGSIVQAQAGHSYTETTAGTLGPSVRAIVPIKDSSGQVTGMVAAGVTVSNVQVLVAARLTPILWLAAALLLGGSTAAWLLGRYLRRVTFGWGPVELANVFAYYESVLHSVREGLVLVDPKGEIVLYNDHAALLLGLPERPDGAAHASLETLPEPLRELLRSGRSVTDEVHVAGDRLLVVSQRPAVAPGGKGRGRFAGRVGGFGGFGGRFGGRADGGSGDRKAGSGKTGTVASLRDHTELTRLAGSLSSTQTLVTALRSQTHEHANRLHAIISLIELDRAREALDFASADLSQTLRLGEEFVGTLDEPFLAALLVGKRSQAEEHGVRLELSGSGTLAPGLLDARELVTVLGNLVDNAIDAVAGREDATVWADLLVADGRLTITVADNGPGLPTTNLDELARIGTTAKESLAPGGRGFGLALVRRAVAALGGTLTAENDGGAVFAAVVPLPGGAGDAGAGEPGVAEPGVADPGASAAGQPADGAGADKPAFGKPAAGGAGHGD